jgi:capsular exopolysaccharide synthesis family protein
MDKPEEYSNRNQNKKNPLEIFRKYFSLFFKNKYWILIIFLVVTVGWSFVYLNFFAGNREYYASVIIKFDNPKESPVMDFAQTQAEAKIAILRTKTFLKRVCDSLKLNLVVHNPNINRLEIFKEINVTDSAKTGFYRVRRNRSNIDIYFTNKQIGIENKKIKSLPYENNLVQSITINGFSLELDVDTFNQLDELKFSLIQITNAVEVIKSKIQSQLDRSKTLLTIGYSDTDPDAAAFVTNKIAELYIDELLEHKRYKTSSILGSLKEQMIAAETELNQSDNRLKNFREQNPYLQLTTSSGEIVNRLLKSQDNLNIVSQLIEQLKNLLLNISQANIENSILNYSELLNFLESQNLSAIKAISEKYKSLVTDRKNLLNNKYSNLHPQVISIEDQLKKLQNEIFERANKQLSTLEEQELRLGDQIDDEKQNLKKLPRNELILAELQRDRDVKEKTFSSISLRYNEAKVADASVVPDAYIIDSADPPLRQGGRIKKLKGLMIGPFLGLILGIGLFVLIDFLDERVKSGKEMEEILNIPLLASIPVIGDEREIPKIIEFKNKVDPKLITADYAPNIAGESFRLLRTKLIMKCEERHKSFVIASLNPGEGKSLVAANLAITFAQQKVKTVLIDCDLRRGVLHSTFGCEKKPGLTELLVGSFTLDTNVVSNIYQSTHVPNLFLITNGTQIPNPSEVLGSTRMQNLFQLLTDEFEAIIFDTPPINFISDAFILNHFVKNLVLVLRFGKTNLKRLNDKLQEFPQMKNFLKGAVLNASQEISEKRYSSYSYYHY